jgi:hypothetical protein
MKPLAHPALFLYLCASGLFAMHRQPAQERKASGKPASPPRSQPPAKEPAGTAARAPQAVAAVPQPMVLAPSARAALALLRPVSAPAVPTAPDDLDDDEGLQEQLARLSPLSSPGATPAQASPSLRWSPAASPSISRVAASSMSMALPGQGSPVTLLPASPSTAARTPATPAVDYSPSSAPCRALKYINDTGAQLLLGLQASPPEEDTDSVVMCTGADGATWTRMLASGAEGRLPVPAGASLVILPGPSAGEKRYQLARADGTVVAELSTPVPEPAADGGIPLDPEAA